jgi:hypothetical protein
MEDFNQDLEGRQEARPLNQRIEECLSIESDDPIVRMLQECLRELNLKYKKTQTVTAKKSQWHTWG